MNSPPNAGLTRYIYSLMQGPSAAYETWSCIFGLGLMKVGLARPGENLGLCVFDK